MGRIMVTVTKQHNGLLLSTIYKGYLVTRLYQGYSVRESRQLFKQHLRTRG